MLRVHLGSDEGDGCVSGTAIERRCPHRRGACIGLVVCVIGLVVHISSPRSEQRKHHCGVIVAGGSTHRRQDIVLLSLLLLLVLQLLLFSQTLGLPTRTGDLPRQKLHYTVALELARHVHGHAPCSYALPPRLALGSGPNVNHVGR